MGVGLSVLGLAHDLAYRADKLQAAANALSQYLGPVSSEESRVQLTRQLSRLGFRTTAHADSVIDTLVSLDSEASYLKDVIDQLNRLSSSRREKIEKLDLAEAVKEVAPLLYAVVAGRATITFDLASEQFVRMNRTSLARILINLVTNSVEWKARRLTVRVGPADRERGLNRRRGFDTGLVSLSVLDDGAGMSPKALEHCRDAFVTERSNGTGLGLFVVDKLVRSVSGEVIINSQLGEGTQVLAVIPIYGGHS